MGALLTSACAAGGAVEFETRALAPSAADAAAATRVLDAVGGWAAPGPAPLVGRSGGAGRTVAVEDAVYAATALSVALDFDDYVSFGHTGHSSVLVPALLAAETGSSGADQLVAQVVANEVEARLGGACLIGPLNGQLWSFIHAAGSAGTSTDEWPVWPKLT